MITVRLETAKVRKEIRHLFPYPKLIMENGFRLIHEFQIEHLVNSDIEQVRDAVDYILRNEEITLSARQNIIDKIVSIIDFYKDDQHGSFTGN